MIKKWVGFSFIYIVLLFYNFEILFDLIFFGVDVNLLGECNSWFFIMLVVGNDIMENEVNINNLSKMNCNKIIEILFRNGVNINFCEVIGKSVFYIVC